MKRAIVLAVLAAGATSPLAAGGLEDALENRWLGAYVVAQVETHSDCMGAYTNNRLNGRLVSGRGRFRFKPGELGKITKVDAKRSRLDLLIRLEEPLLVPRQDGPFTLYDEVGCALELQVELPRKLVSGDDVRGIEQVLSPVLARFATADEAQGSKGWNRRERDPYPRDYERTLAEHAAWKAEQTNAAVQARLERARDEASRVGERLSGDADYLAGLARGVEAARSARSGGCSEMLARDPARATSPASQGQPAEGGARERFGRGYKDGQILSVSLDQLRRLPGCFVPVPEVPPPARAAREAR